MTILNGRMVGTMTKLGMPILFCALSCCSGPILSNSTKNVPQPQVTSSGNQNPPSRPHDPLSPSMSRTAVGQMWRGFVEDGKYRLASADDFKFPQWAVERQLLPQRDAIEVPFIPTSIGFVAIVVNTARDDAERFGLVILDAEEITNEQTHKKKGLIHWIYRDKDLSRAAIGVSSGRVYLQQFEEDGTYVSCDIVWDDLERRYTCKSTKR
jgi:hypothetical protein